MMMTVMINLVYDMSFYLTLSSHDNNSIKSFNGGDFTVQLYNIIDLKTDEWEVALVEMSYSGQNFHNLPTDSSIITVRAPHKAVPFENDYLITYDQAMDLWIKIGEGSDEVMIKIPRQHYNWRTFKETIFLQYKHTFGFLMITDEIFSISGVKEGEFTLTFSNGFIQLFSMNVKNYNI